MRVALDTNVMAYAEGVDDEVTQARAIAIIENLSPGGTVIPAQALAELFNVLVRKGFSRELARVALLRWQDGYPVIETDRGILLNAAQLAVDHQLRIWDSIILASSSRVGCRVLLSEDFQDGFTWGDVTVVNPFAVNPHPLLQLLFSAGSA